MLGRSTIGALALNVAPLAAAPAMVVGTVAAGVLRIAMQIDRRP